MGTAVRLSTATKTARMPRAAASAAMVLVEPQPHSGAWMMLNTSMPIPRLDRTSPGPSTGRMLGSRDVGTAHATKAATIAATGTMNRNTLPHQ